MVINPIKTRVFKLGDNLLDFISAHIKKIPEKSIVVVTSKIVAIAEGRVAVPNTTANKVRLIKQESQWAMKTKYTWLTIKDNMVMPAAGIDESNADGKLILLPKDCFKTADKLRVSLKKKYRLKNLGVIITDSRLLPLRAGTVGIAMGYAGFKGIKMYKGKPDIFGRLLHYARTDVADSLATAAVLTMGEADEQRPLAIISNAPIEFSERVDRKELEIDIKEDLYQPLFQRIKKIKLKK